DLSEAASLGVSVLWAVVVWCPDACGGDDSDASEPDGSGFESCRWWLWWWWCMVMPPPSAAALWLMVLCGWSAELPMGARECRLLPLLLMLLLLLLMLLLLLVLPLRAKLWWLM
ncbi:hypothetical protein EGW08_001713, partial [Elysia chlorotica]